MTIYLAFLRAINLPGHKPVAMADLRELLTRLGFGDPRSLLQSGNLVFRSKTRSSAGLERLRETEAAQRLGLETDFFVRTVEEWREIVNRNPFPKEAEPDPGIEKKLGSRGTGRNWNTILRLGALEDA